MFVAVVADEMRRHNRCMGERTVTPWPPIGGDWGGVGLAMAALSQAELALARRAWRLGVLTTGDAAVARRALAMLTPPARGEDLDADRLDRLAIQSLRRAVGPVERSAVAANADATTGHGGAASIARVAKEPVRLGAAHGVVVTLPLQAAEAFVLRRVDDLDPIRACRAMDCSRSAADRFLKRADDEMAARLGEGAAGALAELRQAADGLTPDADVIAASVARAKERHRSRVAMVVGIVAAGLGVLWVVGMVVK